MSATVRGGPRQLALSAAFKVALILIGLLCAVGHPASAYADVLSGQVVGVIDGDTVTVLDAERVAHRVRLAGIDAPETGQPFSDRAKEHLAGLVYQRDVLVYWIKFDRYRRVVGKVTVEGLDVCLEMVTAGFAWHYKAFELEQTPDEREAYASAEARARYSSLGLWAEQQPTSPWEYRAWRRVHPARVAP